MMPGQGVEPFKLWVPEMFLMKAERAVLSSRATLWTGIQGFRVWGFRVLSVKVLPWVGTARTKGDSNRL